MVPVDAALIRKSRIEVRKERLQMKVYLKKSLSDRGDIAHIHKLMLAEQSISYQSVAQSLNPDVTFWSPRVIAFAQKYVEAKKHHENSQSKA